MTYAFELLFADEVALDHVQPPHRENYRKRIGPDADYQRGPLGPTVISSDKAVRTRIRPDAPPPSLLMARQL